jgi:hypothetical protein
MSERDDGQPPQDPLGGAEREFEAHERALWEELMALMEGNVPPGATVGEAIEAMREAAREDPEVIELTFRIMSMARLGGGAYLRAKLDEPLAEVRDEPAYRIAEQPTRPLVEEEIHLMDRLSQAIDEHVPKDLTGAERRARGKELIDSDPELTALAERLEKLSESHDQSVMRNLARLAEEEEEQEEREEEE